VDRPSQASRLSPSARPGRVVARTRPSATGSMLLLFRECRHERLPVDRGWQAVARASSDLNRAVPASAAAHRRNTSRRHWAQSVTLGARLLPCQATRAPSSSSRRVAKRTSCDTRGGRMAETSAWPRLRLRSRRCACRTRRSCKHDVCSEPADRQPVRGVVSAPGATSAKDQLREPDEARRRSAARVLDLVRCERVIEADVGYCIPWRRSGLGVGRAQSAACARLRTPARQASSLSL
jgi:hypothetical protein